MDELLIHLVRHGEGQCRHHVSVIATFNDDVAAAGRAVNPGAKGGIVPVTSHESPVTDTTQSAEGLPLDVAGLSVVFAEVMRLHASTYQP